MRCSRSIQGHIGVGAAFGDKTGVEHQGLFMVGGDRLAQGRLVECNEVETSFVAVCQGMLVIGTVAPELVEG